MRNQIETAAPVAPLEQTIPEHEVRRPGWKTSEFWVSIAAIALPLLDNYFKTLPPESAPAIYGGAIVAAGFVISRGLVKKSRNDNSGKVEAARIIAATVDGQPAVAEVVSAEIARALPVHLQSSAVSAIIQNATRAGVAAAYNQKRSQK